MRAVEVASPEALAYRPAPDMKSAAETVRHLSLGRINWFQRMDAPGSRELVESIAAWTTDRDRNRSVDESKFSLEPAELLHWLQATWDMIDTTLAQWTVDDLFQTYRHTYWGQTYVVSHQWTIWRIMCHDIYHGGQLTILLGSQGIDLPELSGLGGHLTELPLTGGEVVG